MDPFMNRRILRKFLLDREPVYELPEPNSFLMLAHRVQTPMTEPNADYFIVMLTILLSLMIVLMLCTGWFEPRRFIRVVQVPNGRFRMMVRRRR